MKQTKRQHWDWELEEAHQQEGGMKDGKFLFLYFHHVPNDVPPSSQCVPQGCPP